MGDHEGVHNLLQKSDYTKALDDPSLMVIDCFATWCGPCKVIAPEVVKLAKKYPSTRFYKLDVDEVPDVAHELRVRAMPTFLLFKNGQKVGEVVGANKQALEAAVEKYDDGATGAESKDLEGAGKKLDDGVKS